MLESYRFLNRDQIKMLAIIAMTFNHIAHVLLVPGSVMFEVFEDIGYFTAITMCFFLLEGYRYTRSKKAYAKRLFLFALISEIPFLLAMGYFQMNVIFTLFICFLIFCVMDSSLVRRNLLVFGLVLTTIFCDWAILLAVAAVLFKKHEKEPRGIAVSYGIMFGIFWLMNIPGYALAGTGSSLFSGSAVLHGFFTALPIAVSGVATLVLYNGRKSEKCVQFNKWFFYIYYPAHLLLLWLIKVNVWHVLELH